MKKVYVRYFGGDDIRYSNGMTYGVSSNANVKYNEVLFTQVIPTPREIYSSYYIDSYRIVNNQSFAQAGHETHNMR